MPLRRLSCRHVILIAATPLYKMLQFERRHYAAERR